MNLDLQLLPHLQIPTKMATLKFYAGLHIFFFLDPAQRPKSRHFPVSTEAFAASDRL